MKVKEIITDIINSEDTVKMYKLNNIVNDLICDLKNIDIDLYHKYKTCLYELAYGKIIMEEKAIEIVKCMKPLGEEYSINEVKKMIDEKGLKYNYVDFYLVINSLYNDYCDLFKNDDTTYINMAKLWLDDEDATRYKVYEYFTHIPSGD